MIKFNIILLIAFVKGFIEKDLLLYNSYLQLENKILRSKLGKRIKLTDTERIKIAEAAKHIGHNNLAKVATIAKVDTIRKWWRELIKQKHNYYHKRRNIGRPPIMKNIQKIILSIAIENKSWGYKRIQGSLKHLGHNISHTTIKNIMKENNLDPTPEKNDSSPWHVWIKAHKEVIWATDFFTYETLSLLGPITYYVLIFINLNTREVKLGGITRNPNEKFILQIARNITDCVDPLLNNCEYIIMDRDTKFTKKFKEYLKGADIKPKVTTRLSPDLNAYAERFILSIKNECLNHMILCSYQSVFYVISQYIKYYNTERPHQGIDNKIPASDNTIGSGKIKRKSRLGGLLNYYYREAA